MTALKYDKKKPAMHLLSRVALEGQANVLGFGEGKYSAHNWRAGFNWSRLIGAAMRHLTAFMDGEDLDPESGLPHVDHLACCVMFLSEHQKKNLGTDDRFMPGSIEDLTPKCSHVRPTATFNGDWTRRSLICEECGEDLMGGYAGIPGAVTANIKPPDDVSFEELNRRTNEGLDPYDTPGPTPAMQEAWDEERNPRNWRSVSFGSEGEYFDD